MLIIMAKVSRRKLEMCHCAAGTEWHSVAQLAVYKFRQKVRLRPIIAVLFPISTAKNAKSTDKTLSPIPSF